MNEIQWGLEYQAHWNTERFGVRICNGSVFIRLVMVIVLTTPKPNYWKSEQIGHLFGFPKVLDEMAAILSKTECHWKTNRHWQIEQRATIRIPDMLGIPAPTKLHHTMLCYSILQIQCFKFGAWTYNRIWEQSFFSISRDLKQSCYRVQIEFRNNFLFSKRSSLFQKVTRESTRTFQSFEVLVRVSRILDNSSCKKDEDTQFRI